MTARLDDRKIAAARLFAAARFPYLASALFACAIRAEPDCGTIAVDRSFRIYADPVWAERLSAEQLGRLLAHHVGHLVRAHADRADALGVVDAGTGGWWNRCSDAEINDDLALDVAVPEVAPDLPAHVGGHEQDLAEHYYEHPSTGPRLWDCGSGADGIPRPWDRGPAAGATAPGEDDGDGLGGSQAALLRLAVAADIQQRAGRDPGTVPGGWLRWAETVLPSRTDWRRVLAAEIRTGVASAAGKVDYTYRRPSRRAGSAPGFVLPSLHRPVPEVAIVCDTSGSMHETLLARALAEVEGILVRAGLRQTRVRVLAVDTNVHAVRRVTSAKQVQLAGGGGTDMGAGIAAAASLRPRPSVVIVLTDGFTPWPERPPKGIRVVVGLLVEPNAPMAHFPSPEWARTVRID